MEFSRHEYWSGLPFPSPGDLPNPGIEPRSPALWADTLLSEPRGNPRINYTHPHFLDIPYLAQPDYMCHFTLSNSRNEETMAPSALPLVTWLKPAVYKDIYHSLYFFISLFIYLFGCTGFSLLCGLFFSCGKQGLLSSYSVWASHCGGFSRCRGFPGSSVGKESACNAGDPSSIPGLGRSAGEGIGYPLQYSWTSLVAQLVKNPPAMWETWVQSLGWKRCPGEGKHYPLQYSGPENSMDCIVHRVAKSWTQLSDFHFHCLLWQSVGSRPWASVVVAPGIYSTDPIVVAYRLGSSAQHVGCSQTKDRTHVSYIERWILYHWTIREAPVCIF